MADLKRRRAVRAFVRDWLLIATLPMSVPIIFISLVKGSDRQFAVATTLAPEAMLAYSLALTFAFLEDIPLGDWEESKRVDIRFLCQVLPVMKNALVAFSILLIGMLAAFHAFPQIGGFLDDDVTLRLSAAVAITALVLAVFVVTTPSEIPRRTS